MNHIIISDFEGPLDLLLHLIKVNDIDINNIKIEEITACYLDYLKSMQELDLNIASEYLVMATELMVIKSASLLPNQDAEEVDELVEESSLKDLQTRLIEYQAYKDASTKLGEKEQLRKKYISKLPSLVSDYTEEADVFTNEGADISLLADAFSTFLERAAQRAPLDTTVTKQELSVNERRLVILEQLKDGKRVTFNQLFEEGSKSYLIITFITLLEMYKKSEINIIQDNNFGTIHIEKGNES